MKHRPKIADVMTSDPATVNQSQLLSEVYDLLQTGDFHHIPVLDGRTPLGMVSSTDILKLVYDIEGIDERMLRNVLDSNFKISDAMSSDVVTIPVSANLRDIIEPMASGAQHSVLIVDDDGALVGIVTSTDLIRLLGDLI